MHRVRKMSVCTVMRAPAPMMLYGNGRRALWGFGKKAPAPPPPEPAAVVAAPPPPVVEVAAVPQPTTFSSHVLPVDAAAETVSSLNPMVHLELFLHNNCGLAWWQVILAIVVGYRVLTFPVVVQQTRISSYLATPEASKAIAEAQRQMIEGTKANDKAMQMAALVHRNEKFDKIYKGLRPWRAFQRMMIELPFFGMLFFSIRTLLQYPNLGLQNGGTLWFVNLSIPDGSDALPAILCGSILFYLGASNLMSWKTLQPFQQKIVVLFGILPFVSFIFTRRFAAAYTLMWATSNSLNTTMSFPLLFNPFRRLLGIPPRRSTTDPKAQEELVANLNESINNLRKPPPPPPQPHATPVGDATTLPKPPQSQ
eukprot:TRINITY_DN40670_c0_g1_i1.p1 TRINITY_DN40670_c0_g1~~TRINITY_DN40670_c0_g1_i1.p1  ORF type:complete len:376 (+),score=73.32 TRINITY_DN40670_c0_g1_i1:30-1130(+)